MLSYTRLMKENPLRAIRLSRSLTQAHLAALTGATPQVILRAEQGVYALPPPHILSALAELSGGLSVTEITALYQEWQIEQRQAARQSPLLIEPFEKALKLWEITHAPVANAPVAPDSPNKAVLPHPLARLRTVSGVTQIGLCKALCVNPGPIHKWEAGTQLTFPGQLLYAMSTAGYSNDDIDFLSKAALAWLGKDKDPNA